MPAPMEARFQTLCVFVLLLLSFWNREVNMSFELRSYCKLIPHQVIIPVTFLDQFLQFFPVYQEFLGILYPEDVLPCHFWRRIPRILTCPPGQKPSWDAEMVGKKFVADGIPTQTGTSPEKWQGDSFWEGKYWEFTSLDTHWWGFFTQILPCFCDHSYLLEWCYAWDDRTEILLMV